MDRKKKRQKLPPNIRSLVYSYLQFQDKFKLIYVCKREFQFLAEWRLYHENDEEHKEVTNRQLLLQNSTNNKDVTFNYCVDIHKVLKEQLDREQIRSKNTMVLVRNMSQIISLQINDFSSLSLQNMKDFIEEIYGQKNN